MNKKAYDYKISPSLTQNPESFSISLQNWLIIVVCIGVFLIFPLLFIWSSLGIIDHHNTAPNINGKVGKSLVSPNLKKTMVQKDRFGKKA